MSLLNNNDMRKSDVTNFEKSMNEPHHQDNETLRQNGYGMTHSQLRFWQRQEA